VRYGFCTNFASHSTDAVDLDLLQRIHSAGFDEVELPLCLIENLDQGAFEVLAATLPRLRLGSTICTNFFPDQTPLTGTKADRPALERYLGRALDRAARLGVRTIVFASVPAWQVPPGGSRAEGRQLLADLMTDLLIPRCALYGMTILIEPLRRTICDLINTLADGMALVEQVRSPWVGLAADSTHMLSNGEDPRQISEFAPSIGHVHVVELQRALPAEGYSPGLEAILSQLAGAGYNRSISFETVEGGDAQRMKAALARLKARFAQA
jgi:D-psicose/D-tagatose/L-ribulose 3-epimerase